MEMRRCKRIEEVSVMEEVSLSQSHGGVRRSKDTEITSPGKRRKLDSRDQLQQPSSLKNVVVVELEDHCRRRVVNCPQNIVSPAVCRAFCHVSSSLCSSNDSSLDLKAERIGTEISLSSNEDFSGEGTPSSELCLDSEEMESSSSTTSNKKPAPPQDASSRRKQPTVSKIPPAAEIEEFFSVAEKYEQKRFADKYNYDIVNDVPMEGRYQWVRLKP